MKKLTRYPSSRLLIGIVLCLVLSLALVQTARAVEFTLDGYVPAGTVINDDVFISAEHVIIDGTINGDVFINSVSAEINGTINGNLIANGALTTIRGVVSESVVFFGQAMSVEGEIQGTYYGMGSTLDLTQGARVGRNIFFTGYSFMSEAGTRVERDLVASAYQLVLEGEVGRDALLDAAALELAGRVERNLTANIARPDREPPLIFWSEFFTQSGYHNPLISGLRIRDDAHIGGELRYTSPVDQSQGILSLPARGVNYQYLEDEEEIKTRATFGDRLIEKIREMLTLMILGVLGLKLTPGLVKNAAYKLQTKPLPAAGWGIVSLAGGWGLGVLAALLIPMVGILIASMTLGGLSMTVFGVGYLGLGLAASLFLLLIFYLSKIIVALSAAQALVNRFLPRFSEHTLLIMLVGLGLYTLLQLIPVVDVLTGLIATLMGVGAVWMTATQRGRLPAPVQTLVEAVPLPEPG